MTNLIDGRAIAEQIHAETAQRIAALKGRGIHAGLAFVRVGEDPASRVYVGMKEKTSERLGIRSTTTVLPDTTTQAELLALIARLNVDPGCHGILVQAPLPAHIDQATIFAAVSPAKDVDGFHPYNIGRLAERNPLIRPCTPYGVIRLLDHIGVSVKGKHCVVVGASNIVGRPMSLELLLMGATTTVTHRFTQDLAHHVREAEILVAAAGKPGLIKGEWIRPGAVVVDVGINRMPDGSLYGDVEFEAAAERAGWITPVPGGVGPMTVAMLMQNTLEAALRRGA